MGAGRLETCWSCRRPVFLAERLVAGGKLRHRTCFTCKRCGNQLSLVGCYETENGDFVCETCPDEEKQTETDASHAVVNKDASLVIEDVKDQYSLSFEEALDSVVQNRHDDMKAKFLQDLVDQPAESNNFLLNFDKKKTMPESELDSIKYSLSKENFVEDPETSLSVDTQNQHSTAKKESLRIKIQTLLGGDFTETLSLLNKEPDSFLEDVSEIIDNIIRDAVAKVETRDDDDDEIATGKLESTLENEKEVLENKVQPVDDKEIHEVFIQVPKNVSTEPDDAEPGDYPEYLNPFAEELEEEQKNIVPKKPPITPRTSRKPPVPVARTKVSQGTAFNQSGQKIIQAPVVNLNPFWSDGEPSSDDDVTKPVPAPRSTVKPELDSSFSRSRFGSHTSLNSVSSSISAIRRKKGPAPLPPSSTKSLQYPLKVDTSPLPPSSYRSPSPSASIRSHRKSKPAPPPPPVAARTIKNEIDIEKKEKNYENKIKQNLSVPDKSSYGQWKRKKGQAPGLPIPQRRRITPLPLPEFYRELEDLEIQQRELERQGVSIEQTIRMYEDEGEEGSENTESAGKDVEGMILQLFEIVNQKNELFRRQAELMYL